MTFSVEPLRLVDSQDALSEDDQLTLASTEKVVVPDDDPALRLLGLTLSVTLACVTVTVLVRPPPLTVMVAVRELVDVFVL